MTVLINDGFTNFSAWTRFEGASDCFTATGGVLTLTAAATESHKVTTPTINIADSRIVRKLHWGSSATAISPMILSRADGTSNTRSIMAWSNGTANQVEIYKRATSSTLVASSAFTPTINTDYWDELITLGNVVRYSIYSSDPRLGTPTALATCTWTISGGDITTHGAAVTGAVGMRTQATAPIGSFTIDDYSVDDAPTLTGVPANTVAPAVTGTRVVGETLTTTDGTWTNSPTSYTYQWTRGGVDISSATSNTYVLVSGDVGQTVRCVVTAHNGTGDSAPATSNGLDIVADMVAGDIQFYTAAAGGLGGSPGVAIPNPNAVFDSVTNSEAVAGDVEYRAIYLRNGHAARSLSSTVAWISSQTTSSTTDIAIGVAPEAAGTDVTAIANEGSPPTGVSFSAPASEGAGLAIGTLGAGQARGVWLRRTVLSGTAPQSVDTCTLSWSGTPT